ncbi:wall-associated receptor kinase 4-like [Spinacia oleracea]|uniref:Wall-associated receptor kinase 4-like n=1 Tax=Spinacia oleracea TaxID=3562 RepID=A0A9R0IA89_SPIOL|nr:wall-associated receptor kinase 4-like [Spinacia oleracea]
MRIEKFGWGDRTLVLIVAAILMGVGEEVASGTSISQIALPNCPEKCGDVAIPYPFGIGDGCYYDHPVDGLFYNITCDYSKVPPVPTYGPDIEIVNITLDGEFRILNQNSYVCYDRFGNLTNDYWNWIGISTFALSTTQNIAGAIGCDTFGSFSGTGSTSIITRTLEVNFSLGV